MVIICVAFQGSAARRGGRPPGAAPFKAPPRHPTMDTKHTTDEKRSGALGDSIDAERMATLSEDGIP